MIEGDGDVDRGDAVNGGGRDIEKKWVVVEVVEREGGGRRKERVTGREEEGMGDGLGLLYGLLGLENGYMGFKYGSSHVYVRWLDT